MRAGSLTVIGTGIRLGQTSLEARACIEGADKVFYLVADLVTRHWIRTLRPGAESLDRFYHPAKFRANTYLQMVDRIMASVRQGLDVCAIFYGHPGVFVYPSHEAIRRARHEGFSARMLPATSAEDCLFADLGVDPATTGCQSFEATDFLVYRRRFSPSIPLILWQAGVTGQLRYRATCNLRGVRVLVDYLQCYYEPTHPTTIYEAAQYPACNAVIDQVTLAEVPDAGITPASTLFIPPNGRPRLDLDMLDRLGIPRSILKERPFKFASIKPANAKQQLRRTRSPRRSRA
jgi:hypothetical protein